MIYLKAIEWFYFLLSCTLWLKNFLLHSMSSSSLLWKLSEVFKNVWDSIFKSVFRYLKMAKDIRERDFNGSMPLMHVLISLYHRYIGWNNIQAQKMFPSSHIQRYVSQKSHNPLKYLFLLNIFNIHVHVMDFIWSFCLNRFQLDPTLSALYSIKGILCPPLRLNQLFYGILRACNGLWQEKFFLLHKKLFVSQ